MGLGCGNWRNVGRGFGLGLGGGEGRDDRQRKPSTTAWRATVKVKVLAALLYQYGQSAFGCCSVKRLPAGKRRNATT